MDERPIEVPPGSRATLTTLVRGALGLSHARARALIRGGAVRVGGEVVLDPALRPAPGAEVVVAERPARPAAAGTVVGPGFRLIHIDRDLAVADKEPGLLVVPTGRADEPPPLVARVAAALALSGRRARTMWVVHRIDRETSGLVLFARTRSAFERLSRQFAARSPLREYVAITEGVPEPEEGVLEDLLVEEETPPRRVRVAGPRERGREARLLYRVEAVRRTPPAALLRVRLETGRRNQIRVQCAARGWPLLGDRFYGARRRGPGRTSLHAARLEFRHPRGGRRVAFEAPVPADLARVIDRLFGKRAGAADQESE